MSPSFNDKRSKCLYDKHWSSKNILLEEKKEEWINRNSRRTIIITKKRSVDKYRDFNSNDRGSIFRHICQHTKIHCFINSSSSSFCDVLHLIKLTKHVDIKEVNIHTSSLLSFSRFSSLSLWLFLSIMLFYDRALRKQHVCVVKQKKT